MSNQKNTTFGIFLMTTSFMKSPRNGRYSVILSSHFFIINLKCEWEASTARVGLLLWRPTEMVVFPIINKITTSLHWYGSPDTGGSLWRNPFCKQQKICWVSDKNENVTHNSSRHTWNTVSPYDKANPKVRRHTRYVTGRSLYDLPATEDPVAILEKKGTQTLQLAKERVTWDLHTTPHNFFFWDSGYWEGFHVQGDRLAVMKCELFHFSSKSQATTQGTSHTVQFNFRLT